MPFCRACWHTRAWLTRIATRSFPVPQAPEQKRPAGIAQLVEQLICNHQVPSSILDAGTNFFNELREVLASEDLRSLESR